MVQQSNSPLLAEALSGARDTRALEIGIGNLKQAPGLFSQQFGESQAVVVADTQTFSAAGRSVLDAFRSAGLSCREPFIFPDTNLHAEYSYVTRLENSLKGHTAIPVAVGSGSINDLTKLASHRANRSYLCIPTAASMDGYTAFGASITHEGSKQTFLCPAPRAVLADLEVIAAAPVEMKAWGYADLLAKVTAGADWILADALGEELMHPQAWQIAQSRLREVVADPASICLGKPEAMARLVEGLMLGGFAMQAAGSSRAASGAEHQFSHLWDMQHHTHNGKVPSHGFKVGIGTLASTALYEYLLDQPLESLDVLHCLAQWTDKAWREKTIRRLFGEGQLAEVARRESHAKAIGSDALCEQLQKLRRIWPDLRTRLRSQLLPLAELKAMLRAVGAPVGPEEIGISRDRLRDSFLAAWFIRRRFTVLDLAVRTGLLESALNELFLFRGKLRSSNE
jgi:glycerol-1-phosphate dehydrogenase [NAD(P)+]